MTAPAANFILASASPRRQQLLTALGASFEVKASSVDETPQPGEEPAALALRLATLKARAIRVERPGQPVLAADTVVAVDGLLLEKPRDAEENVSFLLSLSGREHQVITGHVLLNGADLAAEAPVTTVGFRELSEAEAWRYARTGEGLDKAGGYGLQGLGGALVATVSGCHTNVIGLSLPVVIRLFAQLEVPLA